MSLLTFLHLTTPTLILLLFAGVATYTIVSHLITSIHSHLEARRKGCTPPPPGSYSGPFNIWTIKEFFGESRKGRIIEYHEAAHRKYGNTFHMDALGEPAVFTIEPENIKAILSTQFADYDLGAARRDNFVLLFGNGIFSSDGENWAHSRTLLKPQFTKGQIVSLDDLEHKIQNLLSLVPRENGSVIDIQDLFSRLTMDQATDFLFGKSVNSLLREPPIHGELDFNKAFNVAQFEISNRFVFSNLGWLYRPKRLLEAKDYIHKFVAPYVQHALDLRTGRGSEKRKEGKYVFLEALAEEVQDPKVLQDQLLSILSAGRDTTSGLLSWTFFLLARHPQVFDKLQRSIADSVGYTKLPTYQELKDNAYLQNVMSEVLRLYPAVPFNARVANKPSTLPTGGGPDGKSPIYIRKGTRVQYAVYVLHRRKDLWGEDAEEFRPERFEGRKMAGWDWVPFNGGPRICMGQGLALTNAGYVITRMCQVFKKVEPGNDVVKPKLNPALVLSVGGGVPVKFTWRK